MKVYIKDEDVIDTLRMYSRRSRYLLEAAAREGTLADIRDRDLKLKNDNGGWFVDIEDMEGDIIFRRFDNILSGSKLKEELFWL